MLFRALVCLLTLPAWAAPLTVVTYSMPNGATGDYDYRDFTYSPCLANACNISDAPLSGGVGKLTDGVQPTQNWNQYGNQTPWVGWGLQDPTITFYFPDSVALDSITLWMDNSRSGGVNLPGAVTIGGKTFSVAEDSQNLAPRALTYSGLGITGNSVSIQLLHRPGQAWMMLGEVSFAGTTASNSDAPEPGTAALTAAAMAALLSWLRRDRRE